MDAVDFKRLTQKVMEEYDKRTKPRLVVGCPEIPPFTKPILIIGEIEDGMTAGKRQWAGMRNDKLSKSHV